MKLFIDTAANANWEWKLDKAHPAQPRMIRLAWATEESGSERCILVHAGVKGIDPETFARDGISKEHLDQFGIPLADALDEFAGVLNGVTTVVGFSWDFHKRVIDRSMALLGRPEITWPQTHCAMRAAAPVVRVRLQKNKQWAWPSMAVAYQHFAGHEMIRSADPIAGGIAQVVALRLIHQGTVAALKQAA